MRLTTHSALYAGYPPTSPADLRNIMVPLPAEELEAYEVSTYVNSPANASAECIRQIEEP